jgi:hypothetical protein
MLSMLLNTVNSAANRFQLLMGLFFSAISTSRRLVTALNHLGLSVAYGPLRDTWKTLSSESKAMVQRSIQRRQRQLGQSASANTIAAAEVSKRTAGVGSVESESNMDNAVEGEEQEQEWYDCEGEDSLADEDVEESKSSQLE